MNTRLRTIISTVGLLGCLLAILAAPAQAGSKAGSLDRSFGDGGRVVRHFCPHSREFKGAIDSHGRIVVAGTSYPDPQFCVARYLPNGNLDPSFGNGGEVVTDFGGSAAAHSVAIDSKGRIVVAGTSGHSRGHLDDFALARYKPDGTLDSSFGGDGKVTMGFSFRGAEAESVAIDSHDRPVAVGLKTAPYIPPAPFILARFKWNGDPDSSFGGDGKVTTEFPATNAFANSVKIDDQGRIVAGGDTWDGSNYDFAVARYLPDGSPDDSFSTDGQLTTDLSGRDLGGSVAIDRHARIILGGSVGSGNTHRFAVIRYRPSGALDPSFGDDGVATARFKDRAGASSVAIDSEGRIVATGGAFDVARYRSNGHLDHSFSGNGKASAGWNAFANSAVIDRRDRIVVVGWHSKLVLGRFIG